MARNQEKKTPVIVVKKRRVISPTPVADKTETVIPSVPEEPVADAGRNLATPIPDGAQAPAASGKKKKGRPPRRPLRAHWTREFTDQCMKKVKVLFPHLRAEDGGFLPLKVGISRDIPAWLA
ncbi:TPA: proQ/FINO family protein, partial [Escherichia coli]